MMQVAQQCKENIFFIQTLQDFQYTEDVKDLGKNVREKAKSLIALLKDDERLRNERARALKAKERSAQNASAFGSDGGVSMIVNILCNFINKSFMLALIFILCLCSHRILPQVLHFCM